MKKSKLLKVIRNAKNCLEYHPESKYLYSFSMKAIKEKSPEYQVLSDIRFTSKLYLNTAYEMIADGLAAIEEIITYIDDSEITEKDVDSLELMEVADSLTPVYNNEVADFISENYHLVDEYINEFGKGESLINDGMGAYCVEQERMMRKLLDELVKLI